MECPFSKRILQAATLQPRGVLVQELGGFDDQTRGD